MNIPMDVEHEFKWEICNPRKPRHCEYLSPFKRKRVDIDCTDIVKYMPRNSIHKNNISNGMSNGIGNGMSKDNIRFVLFTIYKYLFIFTDILISLILSYLILQLFIFLQKDIMHKLRIKKYELDRVVEEATNNYKINMCDKSTRVPAMNKMCSEWECVIENGNIKYTSVLFEVMGDVCNGFIDRVSWKSILVLSVFFIIYLKFRRGGSK
jgi:hypothetical protein